MKKTVLLIITLCTFLTGCVTQESSTDTTEQTDASEQVTSAGIVPDTPGKSPVQEMDPTRGKNDTNRPDNLPERELDENISGLPIGETGMAKQPTDQNIPEAYLSACDGKTAGETCQVTTEQGEFSGTCAESPDGELMCRPTDGAMQGGRTGRGGLGDTEACNGKEGGETCQTTSFDGTTVDGTCQKDPSGQLMCMPEGMTMPGTKP